MHGVRADISDWYARACEAFSLDLDVDLERGPEQSNEERHRRLVMAILGLWAIDAEPSLNHVLLENQPPRPDWLDTALQDADAQEEVQGFYSGLLIGHSIAKEGAKRARTPCG